MPPDLTPKMGPFNLLFGLWTAATAVGSSALMLAFAGPFLLLPRGRRERWTRWTNRLASWITLRLGFLADVVIEGELPPPPFLVVANHRSFADVLTIIAASGAQGLSKREVFFFPVIGQLGYLGGAVYFDRRKPEARHAAKEECLHMLRQGNPLHVYPEGTRSRDGKLAEKVHLGLLEACWDAGIPLVPCALEGTEWLIPSGALGTRPFGKVRCRFAPALRPQDHPDAHSYAVAAWSKVREMLGQA